MPLLFDRSGQTTGGVTTGFTTGFKCSGSDRLLLVFVCYGGEATARAPSAVTYNSVPLTLVPGSAVHDGVGRGAAIYYLLNPAGGTNNVTVTFAATVLQLFGGFINYHGVLQTAPPSVQATNSSSSTTNPTVTLASSAGRTVVAGVMSEENTTMTITAGTSRQLTVFGSNYCADIGTLDGGGTVSWTTATPGWAATAVELRPSDYTDSSQGDAVRFYPRTEFPDRCRGLTFEGTDGDPVTGPYTSLYAVPYTDITIFPAYEHQTNLNLGSYRYLRARAGPSCYGNVGEVEFYKAGVKVTGLGFGSPGSFGGSGNSFDKALDGNINTFFDAPNPDDQYMGLDRGAGAPTLPDSFTRADNMDLGTTYDPGYSNSAKIISNAVVCSVTGAEAIETWNANTFSNNQFAECKIASLTNTGSIVGVVLRAAAPPTMTMYWFGAAIYSGVTYSFIKKRVNGTETQLIGPTQTWAVGDILRAEANGTTLRILRNGTQVNTTTDSAIAGGRIGIYLYNDSTNFASLDDFNGGDLVVAGGKQPYRKRTGGIPHMRLTLQPSIW